MAAWDDLLRLLEPDTPPAGRPPRVPPETFNSYLRMKRAAVPLGAEQTGLPGIARPPLPAGLMAQLPEDQGGERLFSKPVPRPGYRPLTLPKDRPPTPEEFEAFRAQEEQGIQPELSPPMSPLDFGMDAVTEAVGDDIPSWLLPTAGILGIVRYKKPGVSAGARELAESYHRGPVYDPVEAKNFKYHATDPRYVEKILERGEIVPNPHVLQDLGLDTWDQYTKLKPLKRQEGVPTDLLPKLIERAKANPQTRQKLNEIVADRFYGTGLAADNPGAIDNALKTWLSETEGDASRIGFSNPVRSGYILKDFADAIFNPFSENGGDKVIAQLGYRHSDAYDPIDPGVSFARVPRIASKATKAVSFTVDPKKMPPVRPYAEQGYQKTTDYDEMGDYAPGSPNIRFEFEDRTFNKAVPASAIREMWVDREALNQAWGRDPNTELNNLYDLSERFKIPLREFGSGRQMHRGPMIVPRPRPGDPPMSITEMLAEQQKRRLQGEHQQLRRAVQLGQQPLPPVQMKPAAMPPPNAFWDPLTPQPPLTGNMLLEAIANIQGDQDTINDIIKQLGYNPEDFSDPEDLNKLFK